MDSYLPSKLEKLFETGSKREAESAPCGETPLRMWGNEDYLRASLTASLGTISSLKM